MRVIYILTFWLFFIFSFSQTALPNQINALEDSLTKVGDTLTKSILLNELAFAYYRSNVDKSGEYALKALSIAKNNNLIAEESKANHQLGEFYLRKNRHDEAKSAFESSLEAAEKSGTESLIATSQQKLGKWYQLNKNNTKAIEWYDKSIEIRKSISDIAGLASLYNNLTSLYRNENKHDKALEYALHSLEIRRKGNNTRDLAAALRNVGNCHMLMGNLSEAEKIYQEALPIVLTNNDIEGISVTLNNLGNVNYEQGAYPKSIEYWLQAIPYIEKFGDAKTMAINDYYLSKSYGAIGDFKKASEFNLKAISNLEKNRNATNDELLARAYQQQLHIHVVYGNEDALEWYDKLLAINPSNFIKASAFLDLGAWYNTRKDYQNLLKYSLQSYDLRNEADPITRASSIGQLGIAYYQNKMDDKALPLLEEGINELKKSNSSFNLSLIQGCIANILKKRDQKSKLEALEIAKKSLIQAKKSGSLVEIEHAHMVLANCYEALDDKKNALLEYKLRDQYRDSIIRISDLKEIARQEVSHEVKTELETSKNMQANQQQVIQKQEKAKSNWILLTVGVSFISLVTLYFFNAYQKRRIELKESDSRRQLAEAELKLLLERQRISKDLHDEVGSTLSSIRILSGTAINKMQDKYAQHKWSDIEDKARQASDSISDIIWAINPKNDSFENMVERLTAFASTTIEATGADFILENKILTPEKIVLKQETRKDLYLILKEIINNAAKHSKANTIKLSCAQQDQLLEFSVEDNGIGINNEATKPKLGQNGLSNIFSRAKAIGANITLSENNQTGCKFTIQLPHKPLS